MEQFSQHLLPSLLSLSTDPVANVRVLVAKALRQSVMEKGIEQEHFMCVDYLQFPNIVYFLVIQALECDLQQPQQKDVMMSKVQKCWVGC